MRISYCKNCKYCDKSYCNTVFQRKCKRLHRHVSPNQTCKHFTLMKGAEAND